MKVIIAGGTGLIGGATLRRLLALPEATSVIALSRREIPGVKDPKLQIVIVKDFKTYDEETLKHFEGAEAVVWALGKPTSGREVHLEYTYKAVEAAREKALATGGEKKLRFVYVSGSAVVADQDKFLLIASGLRKMRGEIENHLIENETKHASQGWQSFVARPGLVTKGDPFYRSLLFGHYIPVEELGAALADLAVVGGAGAETKSKLENADLKVLGKAALARAKG